MDLKTAVEYSKNPFPLSLAEELSTNGLQHRSTEVFRIKQDGVDKTPVFLINGKIKG